MAKLAYIDGKLANGPTLTAPFGFAVTAGLIPGMERLDKFGVNIHVQTTTLPEDIWEFGGEYIYDADGTAPIAYISSSNALDVGQQIIIYGLDINGNEVRQVALTNGQNNVTLTTPLWRVYRMFNNADAPNVLNGILYCHTDPTPTNGVPAVISTRAIIDNGHNQTLMALYTVPKGKVAFLFRGEVGIHYVAGLPTGTIEYAHFHYESRRFGKNFTVKKAVSCMTSGASIYSDERSFTDAIPALTDIKLSVVMLSEDMGSFGTFDLLLIDEDMFAPTYLRSIGQPGY